MMSPRTYQSLLQDGQRLESPGQEIQEGPGLGAVPCRHALRERCFSLPLPMRTGEWKQPSWDRHGPATAIPLALVARWLWLSTGLLRRKLDVDWSEPARDVIASKPLFARGSPSAGSLYPIEIHLVSKGVTGLDDGVYQYAEGHASLWRLRSGDRSDELCSVIGDPARAKSLHLVLVGRYWKTVFKYGAFGYQTMTEDVGALLESLLRLIGDDGFQPLVRHRFPDREVDDLVGVDGAEAASLAIVRVACLMRVPRPIEAGRCALPCGPVGGYGQGLDAGPIPALVSEVHAASRERRTEPPDPGGCTAAIDRCDDAHRHVPLARPHAGRLDYQAMVARHSAMGLQSSARPIAVGELLVLLRAMFAPYLSDVGGENGRPASVRAVILVRRVSGLNPGIYNFREKELDIDPDYWGEDSPMPQKFYRLSNYNFDNNVALVFVVGRQEMAWNRWGDRSLRICNAETGMLAQRAYMSCASQGLSCGAVLGLEVPEVDRFLRLERGRESTLIGLSLGWPLETRAAFIANFD